MEEIGECQAGWANLPDSLLDQIFSLLPPRYRYYASMVCWRWYYTFMGERVWRSFAYRDRTFTRMKFTTHGGFQYHTDHYRLRQLVTYTTRHWVNLAIYPVSELYNLHEFLQVLIRVADYYANVDDMMLGRVKQLRFDWLLRCSLQSRSEPVRVGTGGIFLNVIGTFIGHLVNLEQLRLGHLLLEANEAEPFMTSLLQQFQLKITHLIVVNLTKLPHSFLQLGLFLNLVSLTVSPQHLSDDVICLLSCLKHFRRLRLLQDEMTGNAVQPVSAKCWKDLKATAPGITVHLEVGGLSTSEIVWQPYAPVDSIAYGNPMGKLTLASSLIISDYYGFSLRRYEQKGLQRRYRGRGFHDRCDSAVILLIRNCPNLELLAIRERISTATALLAAHLSSFKPFRLYLRLNAIRKRSDWPMSPDWSAEFYRWLRIASRDFDKTEKEISTLYSNPNWRFRRDNEWKSLFPLTTRL